MAMAVDIFLKIDGIKGESKDDKHKESIEVLSWSWSVSQTGSMATGGGGGTGKASFGDLHITHTIDAASPVLALHCANGKHIPSATLTQRKAGEAQQDFLIWKMTDVIITNVSDSGHDGGGLPQESVSLQYAKIEGEYKPQNEKGTLEAGIKWGWDLKKMVKV
jgi:type VI secretion system secreted protein Hcp